MADETGETEPVSESVANEAMYLLGNVPWGAYQSWSRDGNTVAADKLQDWSDRRDAVVQSLLNAPNEVAVLPAESVALTVALAQVLRGEMPAQNVSAVCVLALARLTGRHDWTDLSGRDVTP